MRTRIVVAGMGRAGSTALWRMAALITGLPSGAADKLDLALSSDAFVLKYHPFDQRVRDWADLVLTPRRDLRETTDSYQRVLPRIRTDEDLLRACGENVHLHGSWAPYSDHEVAYESFRDDPIAVVSALASVLGRECDPEDVLDSVGRAPPRKPMMISERWVRIIEEEEFGDWLAANGYEAPGTFDFA